MTSYTIKLPDTGRQSNEKFVPVDIDLPSHKTAQDFVDELEVRSLKVTRTNNGWQCQCPAHDDTKPSLSVHPSGDKIVVNCKAGCKMENVVEAIGWKKSDLMGPQSNQGKPKPVATYFYRDAAGNPAYRVTRYPDKKFPVHHPDPDKPENWLPGRGGKKLPYRLPELIAAVKEGRRVFISEGEKDANTLVGLGLESTTNCGGVDGWKHPLPDYFADADVVVIPDKDGPGLERGQKVAASLHGVAASVRVLELPDRGEAAVKDITDWVDAGGTLDELEALVEQTPAWEPAQRELDMGTGTGQEQETGASDKEPEEEHWLGKWAGLLLVPGDEPPKRNPVLTLNNILIAEPGSLVNIIGQQKGGKTTVITSIIGSLLAEDQDVNRTLGFTGFNPDKLPILHIDTEQPRQDFIFTHWTSLARAGIDKGSDASDRLIPIHTLDHSPAVRREILKDVVPQVVRKYGGLRAIILDGVVDFVTGFNEDKECLAFGSDLVGLAHRHNCVVISLIHTPKDAEDEAKGHLGQFLMQKATSNLVTAKKVEKMGEKKVEVFTIWSKRNRGAQIEKGSIRHRWDQEKKMHVLIKPLQQGDSDKEVPAEDTPEDAKLAAERKKAEAMFRGKPAKLSADELRKIIMPRLRHTKGSADNLISKWCRRGILERPEKGWYQLA